MTTIIDLSPEQLRRAAVLRERIEELQNTLRRTLGAQGSSSQPGKRRKISAEGLARIRASQLKRWAKVRKGTHKKNWQPKPKMSAETRAKISAIAKSRWAAAKRAGKKAL